MVLSQDSQRDILLYNSYSSTGQIISLLFSSDGEDTVVLYKVLKFCYMPGSEPGPLCGRRETYANHWTTL